MTPSQIQARKQAMIDDAIMFLNDGDTTPDDGIIQVSDLSEVPDSFRGEVLHVNDHGNITLYRCFKCGKLSEIASRV